MADFLVAILSTLVIFLLSYLFWKLHTRRNSLTNESNNRPAISRAHMLQNRIKRFDVSKAGTDDISKTKKRSMQKTQEETEDKDESVNRTKSEDYAFQTEGDIVESKDTVLNFSGFTNGEMQGQSNSGDIDRPISKKLNTWVTLSTLDTNEKLDPVIQPLTSVDELLTWTEGFDELNISSVPLRRVGSSLEYRVRTIVCHDMKGGYVQDR